MSINLEFYFTKTNIEKIALRRWRPSDWVSFVRRSLKLQVESCKISCGMDWISLLTFFFQQHISRCVHIFVTTSKLCFDLESVHTAEQSAGKSLVGFGWCLHCLHKTASTKRAVLKDQHTGWRVVIIANIVIKKL